MARSPLSGLLSEGQVGGAFAAAFARTADALVLEGRAELQTGVLWIDQGGRASLRAAPELAGLDARAAGRSLFETFGPCASLVVGPAGEKGIPFANLGTGEERPSFVGRGGLGAFLGRMGLKAIAVGLPREAPKPEPRSELTLRLASSPRLAARAAGGTLELFHAFAARGDLPASDADLGRRLSREADERQVERKGCRGCPTPCGWIFERDQGGRQGAHFGASLALGAELGLTRFEDSLALLAACDRHGLDAKEAGAVLGLAARGKRGGQLEQGPQWGDRDSYLRTLEAIAEGDRSARVLCRGSVSLARELGRSDEHPHVRGQAARAESSLAAVLGQCVSAAGPDPMRSFPFLVDATSSAGLQRILGLSFPPGATDPLKPAGKGALVFWHENLVSAVDMTGFCSFSMAGLLADELCSLDELALWILPAALRDPEDPAWAATSPGRRLYAAGASLVLLRRRDQRALGSSRGSGPSPLGAGARGASRDAPGLPRAAGAGPRRPHPGHVPGATRDARPACPTPLPTCAPSSPRPGGRWWLARGERCACAAWGPWRTRSERTRASSSACRPPCGTCCAASRARGASSPGDSFATDERCPASGRDGKRLSEGDVVSDGDVLDLVTVISGG